jgi:hypothetical protein
MPVSVSNLKKDANKFADQTLQKLKSKIIEQGLNEVQLPSEIREFRKKFYGITYHGKAELNHGYMKGFQNIRRIGDASLHGHVSFLLSHLSHFSNKMDIFYFCAFHISYRQMALKA